MSRLMLIKEEINIKDYEDMIKDGKSPILMRSEAKYKTPLTIYDKPMILRKNNPHLCLIQLLNIIMWKSSLQND